MSTKVQGGNNTAGLQNVDNGYNARVALPQVKTPANVDESIYVGAVRNFSENDAGIYTGSPYLKSPETSIDYRLRTGMDTIMFTDSFNALTQNTTLWSYTFVTMTCSQGGNGYLQFGTVQGTTSAHGCFMRTFQYFPVIGTAPIAIEFSGGIFGADLVAGEIFLSGLGLPSSAIAIPTDGVWYKWTNAGLSGVLSYNGVLTETGILPFTQVLGTTAKYVIVVSEQEIEFWVDDDLLQKIQVPNANGQPFQGRALPAFMQRYNTGVVSNIATIRITDITVTLMDIASNKLWSHQTAGMGQHLLFGQDGQAQGKTTLWANNTAPTAVALSNTTASFTGLGGIVAVLPTLAVNTDGKLITFQNPVPSINITGRNMYITRVTINGAVSVILAGGAVVYALALAVGHTNTSLATTESASFANNTTHAPRVIPLGMQSYPATAPVGTIGGQIDVNFDTPLVVRPSEFIDIVARNIGIVTTTGAITFVVSFGGYWE